VIAARVLLADTAPAPAGVAVHEGLAVLPLARLGRRGDRYRPGCRDPGLRA